MKVAIYSRVSRSEQNPETQLRELRVYCEARSWTIIKEFVDEISGESRQRPALDECMRMARRREFDVLLVWHFDRFARSAVHALLTMNELRQLGINFVSLQQQIDTTTPIGEAMFHVSAAFAELELKQIRERVRAGIRRSRAEGKPHGRPPRQFDVEKVYQMRQEGRSLPEIGRDLKIPLSTLFRHFQKPGSKLRSIYVGRVTAK